MLFGRFFKPGWKSEQAADRLAAVRGLDSANPDQLGVLKSLALSDASHEVQRAALRSISDFSWLVRITPADAPAEVFQAVRARVMALLSDEHPETTALIEEYVESAPDPDGLVDIACHAWSPDIRQKAAAKTDSEEHLARLVEESRFHDTRVVAASRIHSMELVERAWRAVKKRDKAVARQLHDRLRSHKEALSRRQQQAEEAEQLLASMQALAASQWTHAYQGQYLALCQRWESLDLAADDQRELAFHQTRQAASEAVERHAAIENSGKTQTGIVHALASLQQRLSAASTENLQQTIEEVRASLDDCSGRWRESLLVQPAEDRLARHYEQRCRAVDNLLAIAAKAMALDKDGDGSNSIDQAAGRLALIEGLLSESKFRDSEAPVFIANLVEEARALRRSEKARIAQAKATTQGIEKQLRSLRSVIASGDWSAANAIYHRLAARVERLDQSEGKAFKARLAKAKVRLDEIGDWRSFATAPKLEALCRRMEEVPQQDLGPRDRAGLIKHLQDEWKAMGGSPESANIWPRFKTAADTAYAPCAAFFEGQREQRERNIQLRREICQQLADYLTNNDWDRPDWKLVEKTRRVAKQEWHRARAVARKENASLERRFTELLQQMDSRLDAEYERNEAQKRALIEKAAAYAAGEINQHSLNLVKQLQAAWKQVGIVRRKSDRVLWEQFNSQCKAVFDANRQQQKQQYQHSIAHVQEARDILQALSALVVAEPLEEKRYAELLDRYQSLPEFPARERHRLARDYQQITTQYDRQRERMQRAAERAVLDDLRQRAALCDQLDRLLASPPEDLDAQLEIIDENWRSCSQEGKKRWLAAINQRHQGILDHLRSGTTPDYAAANQRRRLLCIQLEIVADVESPPEDRALRMEYQLQQLQQGRTIGQSTARIELLMAIEVDWLCAEGASQAQAKVLRDRFARTLAEAIS